MRYLLDTDICIYLIKNRPPEVPEQFKRHPPTEVAISTITVFELEYGAEKSKQRQKAKKALARFTSPLTVLDMDRAAAHEAARIRAELEHAGTPIGPYDILIAGLAKSRGLTLVTNNLREFSRVSGLVLENWAMSL
jgi:tRNA(fMet)-specific endonuclease VapC